MKKLLANLRERFLDAPSAQYKRMVVGEEDITFKYKIDLIKYIRNK
jgi:hypothetical protein